MNTISSASGCRASLAVRAGAKVHGRRATRRALSPTGSVPQHRSPVGELGVLGWVWRDLDQGPGPFRYVWANGQRVVADLRPGGGWFAKALDAVPWWSGLIVPVLGIVKAAAPAVAWLVWLIVSVGLVLPATVVVGAALTVAEWLVVKPVVFALVATGWTPPSVTGPPLTLDDLTAWDTSPRRSTPSQPAGDTGSGAEVGEVVDPRARELWLQERAIEAQERATDAQLRNLDALGRLTETGTQPAHAPAHRPEMTVVHHHRTRRPIRTSAGVVLGAAAIGIGLVFWAGAWVLSIGAIVSDSVPEPPTTAELEHDIRARTHTRHDQRHAELCTAYPTATDCEPRALPDLRAHRGGRAMNNDHRPSRRAAYDESGDLDQVLPVDDERGRLDETAGPDPSCDLDGVVDDVPDGEGLAFPDLDPGADPSGGGGGGWRADADSEVVVVDGVPHRPDTGPGGGEPVGRSWWSVVGGHGRRLPRYWWRLLGSSHRGVQRLVVWWGVWVGDVQARQSIEAARDPEVTGARTDVGRAEAEHNKRILRRIAESLIAVVVAGVVGTVWLTTAPLGWLAVTVAVVLLVVLPVLGGLGRRPEDPPIVERIIYKGSLLSDVDEGTIARALRAAVPKIAQATKANPGALRFLSHPTRMANDEGSVTVVKLPEGVSVSMVAAVRDGLASGVSRDEACVLVDQVPTSRGGDAGMLELTVLDRPLRDRGTVGSPFAIKPRVVDVFDPIPVATGINGQPIDVSLIGALVLVGAVPRMGKTALLQLIVTVFGLDVRTRITIADFKAAGDFDAFAGDPDEVGVGIVDTYLAGQGTAAEQDQLLEILRSVKDDLGRRAKTFARARKTMPAPGNQVTSEMATAHPELAPHVVILDEAQRVLSNRDIAVLVEDIAKVGPALGVVIVLASQAADADTLPRAISLMGTVRVALRCTDHHATDAILGASASSKGHRAHDLDRHDKGVAYIVGGEGADTQLGRLHYLTDTHIHRVVAYARQARTKAGTLTGRAAGVDPFEVEAGPGILELVADAWPMIVAQDGTPIPSPRVATSELLEVLVATHPDRFPPSLSVRALNDELRSAAYAAGWPTPDRIGAATDFVRPQSIGAGDDRATLAALNHADLLVVHTDELRPWRPHP